jgi:hypothetical protein
VVNYCWLSIITLGSLRLLLCQTIDGYVPQGELVDLLFNQNKLSAVDAAD